MELAAEKKFGFNANALKIFAIIAMLIDHIAWAFVPLETPLGQIMHAIGRTTAPLMSFFIAEGFFYTKNVKKYLLRLGIFAVISHFAFAFFETGHFLYFKMTSVIYTLFLALLALVIVHSKMPTAVKVILVVLLSIISSFGDWRCSPILWALAIDLNRGNKVKQIIWFSVASLFFPAFLIFGHLILFQTFPPASQILFQFATLLAVPIILFYNGKKGSNKPFFKWAFYIFYPLHMLIIGLLNYVILA
ncbi:MAG: TraX family protein [Oscillospiraceae bacterium]